jgi:predicted glycosyltransferase
MAHILIDVGHPAHVHLFRGAARRWMEAGHEVLFTALDREMIIYLLKLYDLPYRVTYKRRKGKLKLLLELAARTLITWKIARQFKADLFISIGSPTVGLPAKLLGKPYLALTDTEHATEQHALFKPFATLVATPDVFTYDMGPKQVRYAGYHELAYLHPDEFTPDPRELESLGLKPSDRYFVVRFVAWGATHDIGEHGFTGNDKRELLRELSRQGRVLLSVESGEIDPEFAPLVTTFPPEKVHHLLAFATLYIGEGGTMASEAAVLGTPSIFVNTLTMGYVLEERDYGLLFLFTEGQEVLAKVRELLAMPDLKTVWSERRARLLAKKIDPTPWLVDLGNHLLENPHYHP